MNTHKNDTIASHKNRGQHQKNALTYKLQNARGHILSILGRILFIGFSIQIVLGLLWMCDAFRGIQTFAESYLYVNATKNFKLDEYMSALYPLLLMLFRGLETITTLSYTIPFFVLQLVTAFVAGFYFLQKAGVSASFWKCWGSLVFMTFPMAMQCHMAVLPHSLANSLLILEIAFLFEVIKEKEKQVVRIWLKALIFWFLSANLMPEYLYLGAVPLLLVFFYIAITDRKNLGRKVWYCLLLLMAFAGMISGIHAITQDKGSYGRVHNSIEAALFRRCIWTDLETFYSEWPPEKQAIFDEAEIIDVISCADKMELYLQPKLETILGVEEAREWFGEMVAYAMKTGRQQIIKEVAWDMIGYLLPPVAVDLFLEGRGYDSYCPRNYEVMRQSAPTLTRNYMQYVSWWFTIAVAITVVMQLLSVSSNRKHFLLMGGVMMITAGVIAVWYTLQGSGVWDYKRGFFTGLVWLMWAVWHTARRSEEEKQDN